MVPLVCGQRGEETSFWEEGVPGERNESRCDTFLLSSSNLPRLSGRSARWCQRDALGAHQIFGFFVPYCYCVTSLSR